jgi:hypothetical protein
VVGKGVQFGRCQIVPLFLFPNVFSPVCDATTFVIGLQYDPIICKVVAKNTGRMARYWPCSALALLLGAEHGAIVFPNRFLAVRDTDTLHVVGSYHDPTICKVSVETNSWLPTFSSSCTLPTTSGSAQNDATPFRFSERLPGRFGQWYFAYRHITP